MHKANISVINSSDRAKSGARNYIPDTFTPDDGHEETSWSASRESKKPAVVLFCLQTAVRRRPRGEDRLAAVVSNMVAMSNRRFTPADRRSFFSPSASSRYRGVIAALRAESFSQALGHARSLVLRHGDQHLQDVPFMADEDL